MRNLLVSVKCCERAGPTAGPAVGPVREPEGTSSSPGGRLPPQPRTVGGLRLVRRLCRIDIDVEEPGERQGCQCLRDLLLVSGDDLDERCLPWLGNVVGTYPPLRAQRLKLLMLVISQRGEFCEVRVVADDSDDHERLHCGRVRCR